MPQLEPRNIHGLTTLVTEHLCRITSLVHRLPVVVLRTGRFFPEEDDMAHAIEQSAENTNANEFLSRRLRVEDAAEAHVAAPERAPAVGFGPCIISAPTPFQPEDCEEPIVDAPSAVARCFPGYRAVHGRRGWSMSRSVDRVHSARKAEEQLGFRCRTGFAEVLTGLC